MSVPSTSPGPAINERVIRWSEIRLPHPSRPGELATWELDGPFALRPYYRVEGEGDVVRIEHLDRRNPDGTLAGCLYCGAAPLQARRDVRWGPIVGLLLLGIAPAYWTWGASLLLVAYPLWFLWASAPRVETCTSCRSEFVDFCEGPRP